MSLCNGSHTVTWNLHTVRLIFTIIYLTASLLNSRQTPSPYLLTFFVARLYLAKFHNHKNQHYAKTFPFSNIFLHFLLPLSAKTPNLVQVINSTPPPPNATQRAQGCSKLISTPPLAKGIPLVPQRLWHCKRAAEDDSVLPVDLPGNIPVR